MAQYNIQYKLQQGKLYDRKYTLKVMKMTINFITTAELRERGEEGEALQTESGGLLEVVN